VVDDEEGEVLLPDVTTVVVRDGEIFNTRVDDLVLAAPARKIARLIG
jgi:hypothetical protein